MRATSPASRGVVYTLYVVLTLALIVWGVEATLRGPCRSPELFLVGEMGPCPSQLMDLVALVISLVLWAVAVASLVTGSTSPPLAFFLFSGVLSAGTVSASGSDLATRLYSVLLAWAPLSLYLLQVRLLGQPSGIHILVTDGVLAVIAVLLTVPTVLTYRGPLSAQPWYPLWDSMARLELVFGVAASVALLVWASRGGCAAATRRPIRVATFGMVTALLPVVLLSSLPDLVGLGIRVPYSITLMGVVLLPIMYAHALVLGPDGRTAAVLRRVLVYYLLLVGLAMGFLAGLAALDAATGLPAQDYPAAVILIGGVLVIAMDPVRMWLERLTHWVWFGRASPYAEVVSRLADALSATLDRSALVNLLVHEVMRVYGVSAIGLYLRDSAGNLALASQVGMGYLVRFPPLPLSGGLAETLLARNEPVFQDALRKAAQGARPHLLPDEAAMAELAGIALWIPLASVGRLYGVLLVGPKVDEDWYSAEDLQTLSTIARQSGMAAHSVLLIDDLRDSRRDVERAHQQLLTAGEQEQRRLAQDLHDGAVQQILNVRYRLAEALAQLGQEDAAPVQTAAVVTELSALRTELEVVVEQLREHIGALRPTGLDDLGLAAALVSLGQRLHKEHGPQMPRLVLDLDRRELGLPPEYEINLYRVAQEAIRNAMMHSGASEVVLRLERDVESVRLSVRDDGAGFRMPARISELAGDNHFGLVSMYERMSMLSGTLDVRSAPGAGTEVLARLDYPWEVHLG